MVPIVFVVIPTVPGGGASGTTVTGQPIVRSWDSASGDEFFYDWVRDGSGGYVSPKRTYLNPGATHVGINNLIGERKAHRVEVYMPRNYIDIAGLNGAYQHE
jgi:hypothetical protein